MAILGTCEKNKYYKNAFWIFSIKTLQNIYYAFWKQPLLLRMIWKGNCALPFVLLQTCFCRLFYKNVFKYLLCFLKTGHCLWTVLGKHCLWSALGKHTQHATTLLWNYFWNVLLFCLLLGKFSRSTFWTLSFLEVVFEHFCYHLFGHGHIFVKSVKCNHLNTWPRPLPAYLATTSTEH